MTSILIPDIVTIDDMHLDRPNVIASYLLLGDAPTIVDPGPASTLPALEAGLAAQGLGLVDIATILLTHIHLDHAGATGQIVARNPHIRVYVHEHGAQHLLDPSRLVQSATQLYGAMMDTLWGQVLPVPAAAVTRLAGGETVIVGGRSLRAFDAPGHAKHHLIYLDEASGSAFVGDNCGVRVPGMPLARPATPPPDIDLEAWERTLDLLEELAPRALMLTHYGGFSDVAAHLEHYRARLRSWSAQVRAGLLAGGDEATQIADLEALAAAEVADMSLADQEALRQQTGPLALSWRGLARYWTKRGIGGAT